MHRAGSDLTGLIWLRLGTGAGTFKCGNEFLVNKTTDAPNTSFIGIMTLHVSGSLSAHHQESRVVIPMKLDFSASVGFIHKESVTVHSHMIVKCT